VTPPTRFLADVNFLIAILDIRHEHSVRASSWLDKVGISTPNDSRKRLVHHASSHSCDSRRNPYRNWVSPWGTGCYGDELRDT